MPQRRGAPADRQGSLADLGFELLGQSGGDLVVLIHGLGSSSTDWTQQIPVFAASFRVMTVDLRGHGRSPRPRGRFTVEAMADDVGALLERLHEDRAHLVGLSLGGSVALALAIRDPARVRSLTIVNGFAKLRPAGVRGALRMAFRLGLLCVAPMPVVAAHVARGLFPRPEQAAAYAAAVASLGRNPRRTYLASILALARFDARKQLAEVRCPTLVVAGDRDRTIPAAAAELLRRSIPGARLAIVPDSGHATPYDQPALFNRAVLSFLRSVSEGAPV